jgi:predicted nucleic acid binding AN1-type Zn finger protein
MSKRCYKCKKKFGLLGMFCNFCNEEFCIHCRLQEYHECPCLKSKIEKEKINLQKKLEDGKERSKSEHFGIK